MTTTQVDELLSKIKDHEVDRYTKYWNEIRPKTPNEVFNRWLFSFLSVHTTWKSNVHAFQMLKDCAWAADKAELTKLIIESKVGLTHIRSEGIWKFYKDYWKAPEQWLKKHCEDWVEYRDRLSERCFGLGLTKTAFSCEMVYPLESNVVCLDVHILKLFEHAKKGTPGYKMYRQMEEYWTNKCKELQIPSPIARNIVWDKLLKQETTDYWSHVFH